MNSILEIYNFNYTPPEDIPSFYSRFKALVIKNLKRKGHRIGGLELLQDEILTPTFEDIVLLWCLEKVDSSFPGKIRKNFGEQINSGTPLKELEIEIFKYLSEHYSSSIESDRHIDDILSTVNEDFVIKHETNITFNKLEIETIKQELLECQTKNNNAIDKDIPIEDIAKIECDEEVFADNVDQNSEDYLSDALNDDLSDIDIENGKIEHSSIKEEDSENLKLLQNKASAIKQNSFQTCDICNKKLSSKRRLREHLESVHKKTFTCKLCQEVFPSRKDLILHRTEEHKRKWKAPIPVSCDLCGKACNGKRRLREHLLTKHSKKSCKLCDETFNGIELLRKG